MFIDVHCHFDVLKNSDKSIENAKRKKVKIITAGVNPETNRKSLELLDKGVLVCLGVYPTDALGMKEKELDDEIKFIKTNKDKIWGVGEVGMDFKEADEKGQEKNFEKFVRLAMDLDKPVVVHSRKAELECIELLERVKAKRVVMHYFSGKMKLVKRIVENGWFLSIPGIVKYSQQFQKIVELVPTENLLCETDAPWGHPDREFPNEPANVLASYKMIAKIKKMSLKDVEGQLEKNFEKLCGG